MRRKTCKRHKKTSKGAPYRRLKQKPKKGKISSRRRGRAAISASARPFLRAHFWCGLLVRAITFLPRNNCWKKQSDGRVSLKGGERLGSAVRGSPGRIRRPREWRAMKREGAEQGKHTRAREMGVDGLLRGQETCPTGRPRSPLCTMHSRCQHALCERPSLHALVSAMEGRAR